MLSKGTTMRSSVSTYVTGKDISNKKVKPKESFKSDDVKLIFVKHNRKKSKHGIGPNEKTKLIKPDGVLNTSNLSDIKSILKTKIKSNNALGTKVVDSEAADRRVLFADEDIVKKRKLADITIVPSYSMFYDNVIIDEDNNANTSKKDKVNCKCSGCIIF
jgi:hypothetical protein